MRFTLAYFIGLCCASCGAYNTSFDCPPGKGIGCAPVHEIFDMIVEKENGEDLFIEDLGEALVLRQAEAKNEKILTHSKKKTSRLYLKKEQSGDLVLSEEEI